VQTATAYLDTLNPEQRRAVEHGAAGGLTAPPLLVIAGAGSGKTNTLAHRVAHLIVQGADPRQILLMTSCQSQSTTATASISISHSGAASAETPTSVLAGGVKPSKKAERA
jgi:DNA helicase-2/ATP-dependent DNA helicase PcrA